VAPLNEAGEINLEAYRALITERTQFISIMHVSNALGTINPIKEMIALAHQYEIPVLIDGAQAAPHLAIDVQELDCDFYCISGHKMFAPVGIGVLYGKEALLENMAPYHGGGEMIAKVSFEETLYNILPYKFEAGTPNIAGVIGLGAALDYINEIGIENLHAYEQALLQYATEKLNEIPGLRIIGTARNKVGVLSFTLDKIHAHDIGTILDTEGVAIRSGHHCAMPLMENFNLSATARASLAFYNTRSEVDALIAAIHKVKKVFG